MSFTLIDFTESNGLVFCRDIHMSQNNTEFLLLSDALKLGADAILFRRFFKQNESNPYHSEPTVCIFQKQDDFFNSSEHIELHAAIWSAGKNDVYIIQGQTRLDIINARKPATILDNDQLKIDDLVLISSNALRDFNDHRFSAHLFGSGRFWDQSSFISNSGDKAFLRNRLEEENMPYHQLLTFLKQTRKYLKSNVSLNINTEIIDKFLIISILIKYLEEIKNPDGSHTLSKIYNKYSIDNFADALTIKGRAIDVLEDLGKKLNGKIFDYFVHQEENESDSSYQERNYKIKQELRLADLSPIAHLLSVKLDSISGELDFDLFTKQLKLDFDFSWKQYSFRHLPIELISSIYEHFLQEDAKELSGEVEKGVVYTPPFLVNFLIDEMMPLEKADKLIDNRFKVLDPSCGSGIFLVSAYKRIIQWWIIQNFGTQRQLPEKLDPKVFQYLLETNIFGVDINKKATLITVFSLTIAFLDKLDPVAFWENLNFKTLTNNIRTQNFFEWSKVAPRDFSLVIGNPPFNVPTEYKRNVKKYIDSFVLTFQSDLQKESVKKVPDKNLALYFLEFSVSLSKDNNICLIIPSNVFLYSTKDTTVNYRKDLLNRIILKRIYDFTHLRRVLFKRLGTQSKGETSAEPSVCAIIIENKLPDKGLIEHVVVKRLNATEKKTRFEIDNYDKHLVNWSWATEESTKFIWKTNLLGGGRLFHLINRLSLLRNLNDFILDKKSLNNEWIFQDGYKDPTNNDQTPISLHLNNQKKVSGINKDGKIDINDIERGQRFLRARPETLFRLPLVIIHKKIGAGTLPVGIQRTFDKDYLVFNSSYVGIHAPKEELANLEFIYENLIKYSDTYQLWILATSPSALVGHETSIKKTDIERLPFPGLNNLDYLTLEEGEKLIAADVLNFYKHLGKAIGKGGSGQKLHEEVSEDQLKQFGEVYVRELNSIYERDGFCWQLGNIFQNELYSVCQVGYGLNYMSISEVLHKSNHAVWDLIKDSLSNSGTIYLKTVRIYEHDNGFDCIFLVKPHNQRYWLNSIALRDADETFNDLRKAGF